MKISSIKSEIDYRKALKRLEVIFDAPVNTKEGDEAENLSLLIENYENEHYPIEAPDPIEALKIRMNEALKIKMEKWSSQIPKIPEIVNKKKRLGTSNLCSAIS